MRLRKGKDKFIFMEMGRVAACGVRPAWMEALGDTWA